MKKMVLSLGGSVMIRDGGDPDYIRRIAEALKDRSRRSRLIVVCGGGSTARKYIDLARSTGADEAVLDCIGIYATRLNAYLMISALGGSSYPKPFETMEEALAYSASHSIVVGGGTHPGHTTDAVAALIAERWGADLFLNLTATDGVYTSDPERDPSAVRIDRMTPAELMDITSKTSRSAGSHSPMDPLASLVIDRASIETVVLDGRDLDSVISAMNGSDFRGTRISGGDK